jgi:hypothetical protein
MALGRMRSSLGAFLFLLEGERWELAPSIINDHAPMMDL